MRKLALVGLVAIVMVAAASAVADAQTFPKPRTTGTYYAPGHKITFTKDSDGNYTMWRSGIDSNGNWVFLGAFYCDYDEWYTWGGYFYDWWLFWYTKRYKIEVISPTCIRVTDLNSGLPPVNYSWSAV